MVHPVAASHHVNRNAGHMPLHSSIDPSSTDFARNAEAMRALVADLREKLSLVAGGDGEASRKRHTSRGKMLARLRKLILEAEPGIAEE